MDNWLTILIIVVALGVIIGNLSMVQKNSSQKMRKNNLNDLKETLPRSNKTDHQMDSPIIKNNKGSHRKS